MRIDHEKQRTVQAFAADARWLIPAVQPHPTRPCRRIRSLLCGHFACRRVEPSDVLYAEIFIEGSGQKPAAAKKGLPLADLNELFGKADQIPPIRGDSFPIEPAYLVVLGIGIIVTPLGSSDLVTGKHHRCSPRQQ